ncbi:MAG TPA: PQQ-binding-like beta-propeller repeat protein [Methylomirabilota bacterium]|nr:PQQ-binding-like beta-propeller repeat protein [Methylomirabilota bacterium]
MLSKYTALLVALSFTAAVRAGDWPQWRGPDRTGHVPGALEVPSRLPENSSFDWRIEVGEGFASPVVAGDRVFHLDNQNGRETLHAVSAADGEEIWRAELDDTFRDSQGPPGPRCTPLVDGGRVYAVSCRGRLQCRDVTNGELIWEVNYVDDLGAEFIGEKGNAPGASRHGNNGTPVIDGAHLIACAGGTDGAGVVCFDMENGTVVWKSQNDRAAYAAPVVATVAGVKQVICFTVEGVIGLRRDTGGLLWRVPMTTAYGRHVMTPVVVGDMVVAGSHQVGLTGIRVVRDGDGQKAEEAWVSRDAAVNFSSPVAVGGRIYGLGPAKNLFCVDVETGELLWSKEGPFASADKAHAGFVVMGENVLALTDLGVLILFRATADEYREVNQLQVSGMTWSNPAYANGRLYFRDGIRGTGRLMSLRLTD